MEMTQKQKHVFLGCPLDCDEKYDAIQEKQNGTWALSETDDPLDKVMALIKDEIPQNQYKVYGSLAVDSWLRPMPRGEDRRRVNTESFISFIDQNGCKTVSDQVYQLVSSRILPDIPCMIAIDHSLTGGAFRALSEYYGKDNISLVVLDSHTDAIPMSVLSEAILYDAATNPNSVHDPNDPFIHNRPNSYNASSFLHHLLDEGCIDPIHLHLIGVSDYPSKQAFRIKDSRIKKFVGAYASLKKKGTKIVTKKKCLPGSATVKTLMKNIDTPYVYISIDMDIGALNAVEGVRFRNWKGLREDQIYRVVEIINSLFSRGIKLAGMDIMEIDPRRAGRNLPSGTDQTYRVAANIIKMIFNR